MPSPLRKKKDQERKIRTRQALLDAATKMFSEQGYHQTLISDIVSEARVGQGTFYRNFAQKRDIFEALVDQFIGSLMEEFSAMTANLPTDAQQYRQASIDAISRVAERLDENRQLTLLFLREAGSIDHEFSNKMSNIYDGFAQLAKFYLDHAIARGFARPCNSTVVSQALIGIGLRMMELWFEDRITTISRQDLIAEIVDLAFLGFGPAGLIEPTEKTDGRTPIGS